MTTKPVFIHLLHGRDDPEQDMQGWGFTGPILGPFEAVHFTYKEHIRCSGQRRSTSLSVSSVSPASRAPWWSI